MSDRKEYLYFVVVLTRHHKLLDSYIRATSSSIALDKFISMHDLPGMILEYKFCLVKE